MPALVAHRLRQRHRRTLGVDDEDDEDEDEDEDEDGERGATREGAACTWTGSTSHADIDAIVPDAAREYHVHTLDNRAPGGGHPA